MYGQRAKDLLTEMRRSDAIPPYNVSCCLPLFLKGENGLVTLNYLGAASLHRNASRDVQEEGVRSVIAETNALIQEGEQMAV